MIFIREAEEQDIDRIADLEKECFAMPWSRESVAHDVMDSSIALVLVAESDAEDDGFAGYLNTWLVADEGQVNNIAVMPDRRHRGIGTALMQELIDRLRDEDFSEISLEVRASNDAAIGLYSNLGFEQMGERTGYYLDDGEEALIFKLEL